MRLASRLPFLLLAAASLSACAGPREATAPPPSEPEAPSHPGYETFDPTDYDALPPAAPAEVQHDVPPRLMQGRVDVPGEADAPRERVVDGFRVQVFSSDSRSAAEGVRTDATAWWSRVRGEPNAPADLTAEVAYLQPYYRVRLGAFEFRDEAEQALAFVRGRFPEAFVVPDRVTVRD